MRGLFPPKRAEKTSPEEGEEVEEVDREPRSIAWLWLPLIAAIFTPLLFVPKGSTGWMVVAMVVLAIGFYGVVYLFVGTQNEFIRRTRIAVSTCTV